MQEKEFLDIFRPYEKGFAFLFSNEFYNKQYFLRMEIVERRICDPITKKPIVKPFVHFMRDFFTFGVLLDPDKWEAKIENGKIICDKIVTELIPYEKSIEIEPIPEEPYEPTIEWKDELGYLNLVNPELHEKGLIRTIGNITYYPLNLFKFKNPSEVAKTFHMNDLKCMCGWAGWNRGRQVSQYTPTSTLYYYISDNALYIGRWEYKKYMPLDPVRFKIVGLKEYLDSPENYLTMLEKSRRRYY